MNKGWVLILLISLGFNLGLGLRLLGDRGEQGGLQQFERAGEFPRAHGRWADQDTTARRKMFTRRVERIAVMLDLGPEQQEAFQQVHAGTGHMLMRQRVLIAEKRDLLHALMTNEEVDQDRVRGAIGELGREQAVLDSLVAETVLQEMAVLDLTQRARYLEVLSFDRDGRGDRRGRAGFGRRRQ